jgi:hypothetical protein
MEEPMPHWARRYLFKRGVQYTKAVLLLGVGEAVHAQCVGDCFHGALLGASPVVNRFDDCVRCKEGGAVALRGKDLDEETAAKAKQPLCQLHKPIALLHDYTNAPACPLCNSQT